MAYNTGNPIGSTSPKDLSDNAHDFDNLVNGPAASYPTRLGVERRSLAGYDQAFEFAQENMESRFESFLLAAGYDDLGDYDDGFLFIEERNQIFMKDGELWRAAPSLALPFTTNLNWGMDKDKFVSVGDAALRQELYQAAGSLKVGHQRTRLAGSITSVGGRLSALEYSIWEFEQEIVTKGSSSNPMTWDWQPALKRALEVVSEAQIPGMYATNRGLSGRVLSLVNIPVGLSSTLEMQGAGKLTIKDGYMYARPNFSGNYLVTMKAAPGTYLHDNCLFQNVDFDSRYLCGGVIVQSTLRTKFSLCNFSRFNQNDGIRVTGDNHECMVSDSTFGYKYFGNTEFPVPVGAQWGYGIRFQSQDNRVINSVFHSGGGVYCGAQAQLLMGCQFYSYKQYSGCGIEVRSSKIRIIGCDSGDEGIWIYNPDRVLITGHDAVMENPMANSAVIRLIPLTAGQNMTGVMLVGNTFNRVGGVRCKAIVYDSSQGSIARVRGSEIHSNGFNALDKTATRHSINPYFESVTDTDLDVSSVIPFGVVSSVKLNLADALYASGGKSISLRGDLSVQLTSSIKVRVSALMRGNIMADISVEELAG